MKEKEQRLALVCYGGVSLVLYMHGVIKEILKLSRASKAYHAVPQSEQREHQSYETANVDDAVCTENPIQVYRAIESANLA
jgi:hypothetical protein